MVIVALSDGLGNQMFQYAFGKSLAAVRKDELIIYIGRLCHPASERKYGLDAFNIGSAITSDLGCTQTAGLLCILKETRFEFQPSALTINASNIMLSGYWQSEKYFSGIAALLREEFAFLEPLNKTDIQLLSSCRTADPVCVHVRRTDYLRPTDTKGFVGLDYYHAAVRHINETVANPFFFVFSDDVEWCVQNLNIEGPHQVVSIYQDDPKKTLQIMTECKHFVIANSTFSWWAAWLGRAPDKVVVAPKRWFRLDPAVEWDPRTACELRSDDIVPERWVRM